MKFIDLVLEIYNILQNNGFDKNNKIELIKKVNDNYQIVYFQKSSYDEDFYISLGLYVTEIHNDSKKTIHYDDCDFVEPQIIGLIECNKMNEKKIIKICNKITQILQNEFSDINKLKNKAKNGYFEKNYYKITPELKEYFLGE